MEYLNRQGSGISATLWELIDNVACTAARNILTGRKFLGMDGAYGLGLTALDLGAEKYLISKTMRLVS